MTSPRWNLTGLSVLILAAWMGPRLVAAPAPAARASTTTITALPITIAAPGTYVLDANLIGTAGMDGITVNGDDIIIDLCGHMLLGPGDRAIVTANNSRGIEVRNGRIEGWDLGGVELDDEARVRHLRVRNCEGRSIVVGEQSLVEDCSVTAAKEAGISVESASIVTRCFVQGIGGDPTLGITLGRSCVARDNVVRLCDVGIASGSSCRISDCTVADAGTLGIGSGFNDVITDCTVEQSSRGIRLQNATTLSRCRVIGSTADGIWVTGNDTLIERNASIGNGGAGACVSGLRNRIEDNVLNGNATGLTVNGLKNLVIGNTATGNTIADFQIPSGNQAGPMLASPWWIQGSVPQANFR